MKNEFEIVDHRFINGIQIFVVSMLYRTPHMHRDHELLMILKGSITIMCPGKTMQLHEGDFILFNPFQIHELKGDEPTLILSLQMSQDFFSAYFPQICSIRFHTETINSHDKRESEEMMRDLLDTAQVYFRKELFYELNCAAGVNRILARCLRLFSWESVSAADRAAQLSGEKRIRELTDCINRRCSEKLLLSDIAQEMGLSVFYLSHFFTDHFGMSFQRYLAKIRCENARRQLLLTDQSLLTISIANGFSDSKYFNSAFKAQYGMTPKEYRRMFTHEELAVQQNTLLTTQEFLSDKASLILLDKYEQEGRQVP